MDDRRKDEQPKIEKLIGEAKGEESAVLAWLEKHFTYLVAVACFVMGYIVRSLV